MCIRDRAQHARRVRRNPDAGRAPLVEWQVEDGVAQLPELPRVGDRLPAALPEEPDDRQRLLEACDLLLPREPVRLDVLALAVAAVSYTHLTLPTSDLV